MMVVCSILPDFSQCVGNSVHLFGNNTQCSQMMMTFIQISSLVSLIEGLCSSNSISIRVLGFAFLNRCLFGIEWDYWEGDPHPWIVSLVRRVSHFFPLRPLPGLPEFLGPRYKVLLHPFLTFVHCVRRSLGSRHSMFRSS